MPNDSLRRRSAPGAAGAAEKAGGTLDRLFDYLEAKEAASGRPTVILQPKRPGQPRKPEEEAFRLAVEARRAGAAVTATARARRMHDILHAHDLHAHDQAIGATAAPAVAAGPVAGFATGSALGCAG
jgi:hypothetical protein